MSESWTDEQLAAFGRDGFLIVEEGFLDDETVDVLRERFARLFAQDYETGIRPDEVNWMAGRDPEDRTRQICNGWKADPWIAAQVLSERTGRLAAALLGWDGVRLLQDNCIWKPPGTKSLGMHQDGSYLDYLVPPEMITCWIALDDTSAEAGTITYAAGSHTWPRSPESRGEFHAPPDWLAPLERALPPGEELRLVPIEVKAGGAAFHHFNTFHGSGPNTASVHRRAVISHLVPADAQFHPVHVDPVYSRYRRVGDTTMDESYFPIVWTRDGGRSGWLDAALAEHLVGVLAERGNTT
ncbi:MAG TPA: phytanoyl-CoA dioxygenase family protein [Actinomycetota bacterium]|nr:phytanoyl-CoA dioxygenase family protein [Actinomycetota bacterium]